MYKKGEYTTQAIRRATRPRHPGRIYLVEPTARPQVTQSIRHVDVGHERFLVYYLE